MTTWPLRSANVRQREGATIHQARVRAAEVGGRLVAGVLPLAAAVVVDRRSDWPTLELNQKSTRTRYHGTQSDHFVYSSETASDRPPLTACDGDAVRRNAPQAARAAGRQEGRTARAARTRAASLSPVAWGNQHAHKLGALAESSSMRF